MVLLIAFFLLSLIASFLCSIWEAVLLSITPSYIQVKLDEGGSLGKTLQNFKENIDKPLAAILTLNTVAHTFGAIGVGAQATKLWEGSIIATVVTPVVMTIFVLFLSEIIPKTIGASQWKSLAGFTASSLKGVMWLLAPFVWVSQSITKWLKKDKDKSVLSRTDFAAIAKISAKSGATSANESRIIDNLLKLTSVRAKDIMTPRTVVTAAPEDISIGDFYAENEKLRFSRVPVFENSKDNITGFVMKDDVLKSIIDKNQNDELKSIRRDIAVVTESSPIQRVFDKLMESKEQIALVVDEFGGMSGILSMEDVIETILGMEIVDEFDNVEDLQQLARKNWENRARDLGIVEKEN